MALDWGLANYSPWTKSGPLPDFILFFREGPQTNNVFYIFKWLKKSKKKGRIFYDT